VEFTRIAELLAPFFGSAKPAPLSHAQLKQVSDYLDLLRRWNQKIALDRKSTRLNSSHTS